MRKFSVALIAASLAVPTITVLPISAVQARSDGYYHGKVWRDNRGRMRCKRRNGTTGLIVGAAGGALVGRSIDSHGSRATGTILGAAAGALVGREIDRNRKGGYRCR